MNSISTRRTESQTQALSEAIAPMHRKRLHPLVSILAALEVVLVVSSAGLEFRAPSASPPNLASALSFALIFVPPAILAILRSGNLVFTGDSSEEKSLWLLLGITLLAISITLATYRTGLVLGLGVTRLTVAAAFFTVTVVLSTTIAFRVVRQNANGLEIPVDFLDMIVYALAVVGFMDSLGGPNLDFSQEALGTRAWIVVSAVLLGTFLVWRVYEYRGVPFDNRVFVSMVSSILAYSAYSALTFRFQSLPYWPDPVLRALASGSVFLLPLFAKKHEAPIAEPRRRYASYRLSLALLTAVLIVFVVESILEGISGVAGTLESIVILITASILARQYLSYLHGKSILKRARYASERYRRLVEEAADPIVELDKDGKVTLVNSAFSKQFQIDLSQAIGRRLADLVSRSPFSFEIAPKAKKLVANEVDEIASRSTEPANVIYVRLRKPEGEKVFEGSGRQDRSLKLQLTLRDVTDRVELDRQIAQLSQRLTEEDRSRSELLIKLIGVLEEERRKIAKLLVEGPARDVELAAKLLETASGSDEKDSVGPSQDLSEKLGLGEALAEARTLLSRSVNNLRRAVDELRPTVLEQKGLEAAIRALANDVLRGSVSTVEVIWRVDPRISPGQENLLYSAVHDIFLDVKSESSLHSATIEALPFGTGGIQIKLRFESDSKNAWSRVGLPIRKQTQDPSSPRDHPSSFVSPAEKIEAMGGVFKSTLEPGGTLEISLQVDSVIQRPAVRPTRELA